MSGIHNESVFSSASGKPVITANARPWWVCLSAFIGLMFCYATLGSLTFGLMIPPLSEEFGWSRTDISLGLTFYTFAFVVFSYPIGILMDKVGVRPVLLSSILLFAVMMYCMQYLSGSLTQFYLMYTFLGIVGVGTIPSSYTRVILNWFDHYRGIALAIALSGVGLGVTIIPPINNWLLSVGNWQDIYLFYAGSLLFVCFPAVAWGLKEKPNTEVDRSFIKPPFVPGSDGVETQNVAGYTVRTAAKDIVFLMLVLSFVFLGFISIGVITHTASSMLAKSLSGAQVATAMSLYGISIIIGRLVCGPLLDRFHAPIVAACFVVAMGVGIALIGAVWLGYAWLLLGIFLFGLGGGAEFDFMAYLISRYMGLKAYGRLYGITFAGFYAGGAIGAWAVGMLADAYGNYALSFSICTMLAIIAAAILGRFGAYRT